MPKPTKLIITILLLGAISTYFYFNFSTFKPKNAIPLGEVQGTRIQSKNTTPKPDDANVIGYSKSTDTTQTTYETGKSPSDIQKFYKNILINDGWKLELETKEGTSYKLVFAKQDQKITITSSIDETSNKTIISVNKHKKHSDN